MTTATLTPDQLKSKAETKQAKGWGFKSVADARKNGYNCKRVSMTIREISDLLNITWDEANWMVNDWQYNGLVDRVSHADLNCIYFKSKYKY